MIGYICLILGLNIFASALGNFLLLSFAKTLGIRNKNNIQIRWSNESKPSLGGVSLYIVFLFSALITLLVFAEELEAAQLQFIGLVLAATAGFAMGIADDAYDTKPKLKLFVQISCGVIFILTENVLKVTDIDWVNYSLTIIWVLTLMNSLNMLDNMDGITGTTCVFVLISCLFVHWLNTGAFLDIWSVLILSFIGTLIGFLFFNVHPSRIFMGDGGSQLVGVIVAFFTTKFLINHQLGDDSFNGLGLVLALVALTPSAVDTLTVVINRLRKGKSPLVGGKDHTTHHLVYAGLTDFKVWIVFVLIGLLSCVTCVFVAEMYLEYGGFSLFLGISFFTLIFILLYKNTIKYKQP
ncbi:MAG: UDP-GlcNAc:undecaprenyl-phosphate GlcNAc-1-phosphate transferase [Psychromonas sp.]|jgi:UDP-GlcNAc:undecaprenyl-phosphate GlcNAc-1-phosphate transferase